MMLPLCAASVSFDILRSILFKRRASKTSVSTSSFIAIVYDVDPTAGMSLTPAYEPKATSKSCGDSRELHKDVTLFPSFNTQTVTALSGSGLV